MVASEVVRAERKELQRQQQALDPGSRSMRGESAHVQNAESQADVESSIKVSMKTFLQCAVATVLEAWDDSHRCALSHSCPHCGQILSAPNKFLPVIPVKMT